MKYLGERPKSSYHGSLTRDKYLYESKVAGVGAAGPNRDLFQERLELTGIAGTTYEPYQRHNHHRCPKIIHYIYTCFESKWHGDWDTLHHDIIFYTSGPSTAQLTARA